MEKNKGKSEIVVIRGDEQGVVASEFTELTYIQCPICGHKNPIKVGICEMCSNYLFEK